MIFLFQKFLPRKIMTDVLSRAMKTKIITYVDGKQESMEVFILPTNASQSLDEFTKKSDMSVEKYTLIHPIPKIKNTYLIKNEITGQIKIGNSKNPLKRLGQLQTGNESKLNLIACCIGGEEYERELHKKYIKNRSRGEWFTFNDLELQEIIFEFNKRRDISVIPQEETKLTITLNDINKNIIHRPQFGDLPFKIKAKNFLLIYDTVISKKIFPCFVNVDKITDILIISHNSNKTYIYLRFTSYLSTEDKTVFIYDKIYIPLIYTIDNGHKTVKKWVEKVDVEYLPMADLHL